MLRTNADVLTLATSWLSFRCDEIKSGTKRLPFSLKN